MKREDYSQITCNVSPYSSRCMHGRLKNFCKLCTPVYCETCNKTYSKSSYIGHVETNKHKNNLLKKKS
jgi:hypothetical protein